MYKKSDWSSFFNKQNIPEENQENWYISGLTTKEFKKSELDKSLDILGKILEKERNTFKSLPEDFENVSITELNDEYLPRGAKQKDLLKAITDKRNTFRYKINEPNNEDDNDGLDSNKYDKILNSINETHEWEFERWKKKVTPEFLNEFLADFLQRESDESLVEKNLDGWLKGNDPLQNQDKLTEYTLIDRPEQNIRVAEIQNSKFTGIVKEITISGAEVIQKESELDKSLAGTYLLPYVFNLINFVPEKLKNDD
ncbi:4862_t:CDS:2, partial [Cetraspora pellucida]